MNSNTRITKRVPFCAAHHIPGAGKCERNHGHNWVANITVDLINGDLDKRGFIADVGDLKDAAFKYDHDDLNNYFEYPSTENVAAAIAKDALEICKESNPTGVFIVNVHLIETENNSADASASNFLGLEQSSTGNIQGQVKDALDAESAWEFGGGQVPPVAKATKFVRRNKS